jgi:hypothetical protein
MATEPKPDLPSPDECVRRAWSAAQEAQSRGLPMSSQAVFWQESQAWSLLALALRGVVRSHRRDDPVPAADPPP